MPELDPALDGADEIVEQRPFGFVVGAPGRRRQIVFGAIDDSEFDGVLEQNAIWRSVSLGLKSALAASSVAWCPENTVTSSTSEARISSLLLK
jgi:hypothetical protein